MDAVVIGAGIAGLTAAATLANRNLRTLVLERHNVPGGCASFYQRDGYRFDVGATLAGGFGARGVHRLLNAHLAMDVSCESFEPAMIVHLPDEPVVRYGDRRWLAERLRVFGPAAEPFWRAQERIADLAWDFSMRFPALPADLPGALALARAFRPHHLPLLGTLGRTVASILPVAASQRLRSFVDAQLLITAQGPADRIDLAYGSTALDLAREGTFHLPDGIATIAVALARTVRRTGSAIHYNTSVAAIETARGRVTGVRLEDGSRIAAPRVVSAIPVGNAMTLCPALRRSLQRRVAALPQRWGAFVLYCGLPPNVVPDDLPLHHQVVTSYDRMLGEGNTVFLSFSGSNEARRARNGGRAVTLSTHTDVARWERAYRDDGLAELRSTYTEALLAGLDRVVPGARRRATLIEPADPHTFARYTGRLRGLVGGLPQTPQVATLGALSHHTAVGGLFLCGDTTFPGQSTVGATLSGYNAGRAAAF